MLDLRSKARQRLLAFYFTNPAARRHLRDLAERLRLDPSNLSKELARLERGQALAEAIQKLERHLGREINYTVLTRKEFASRKRRKDAFLENVWHNRRILLVRST